MRPSTLQLPYCWCGTRTPIIKVYLPPPFFFPIYGRILSDNAANYDYDDNINDDDDGDDDDDYDDNGRDVENDDPDVDGIGCGAVNTIMMLILMMMMIKKQQQTLNDITITKNHYFPWTKLYYPKPHRINWEDGEPRRGRLCASLKITSGTLISVNCDQTSSYICQVASGKVQLCYPVGSWR